MPRRSPPPAAGGPGDAPRPRCRTCGEPLGVYEPLILDAGDGRAEPTSLLRLTPDARAAATGRLVHASCHAAVGRRPTSRTT